MRTAEGGFFLGVGDIPPRKFLKIEVLENEICDVLIQRVVMSQYVLI